MTYKVATTDQLKHLNEIAERKGYNRQLNPDFIENELDPGGIHVCSFKMLHEHAGGKPVEPHLRTRWLLKLKGNAKPVAGMLDVDLDQYEDLPEYLTVDDVA